MAHFFAVLSQPPPPPLNRNAGRPSHCIPSMKHSQPTRSDSAVSSTGSDDSNNSFSSASVSRNNSASGLTVQTFSHGPGAVNFQRSYLEGPDEDIIVVPVKLENKFRTSSIDGAAELPSRPAPRSFLKRLTTRVVPSLDNAAAREEKYSIVKMPRGDYKRHFKRDVYGNYAGSEDERKWDEQQLKREYAAYQDAGLAPRG